MTAKHCKLFEHLHRKPVTVQWSWCCSLIWTTMVRVFSSPLQVPLILLLHCSPVLLWFCFTYLSLLTKFFFSADSYPKMHATFQLLVHAAIYSMSLCLSNKVICERNSLLFLRLRSSDFGVGIFEVVDVELSFNLIEVRKTYLGFPQLQMADPEKWWNRQRWKNPVMLKSYSQKKLFNSPLGPKIIRSWIFFGIFFCIDSWKTHYRQSVLCLSIRLLVLMRQHQVNLN